MAFTKASDGPYEGQELVMGTGDRRVGSKQRWENMSADSFGADEAKRDKFLRLMGGKKKSA